MKVSFYLGFFFYTSILASTGEFWQTTRCYFKPLGSWLLVSFLTFTLYCFTFVLQLYFWYLSHKKWKTVYTLIQYLPITCAVAEDSLSDLHVLMAKISENDGARKVWISAKKWYKTFFRLYRCATKYFRLWTKANTKNSFLFYLKSLFGARLTRKSTALSAKSSAQNSFIPHFTFDMFQAPNVPSSDNSKTLPWFQLPSPVF